MQTYEKLFDINEEEISEDPEIKKLSLLVINTLSFLAHQIPVNNNTLALQVTIVNGAKSVYFDWCISSSPAHLVI